MGCSRVSSLSLLLALLFIGSIAHAQQPDGRYFDSNCYYPSVKAKRETQVLYGTKSFREFGDGVYNIGASPDGGMPRVFLAGLPQSPVFIAPVRTGAEFSLSDPVLDFTSNISPHPNWLPGADPYEFIGTGHFHTRDRLDLLYESGTAGYRIYWADEHGRYDSSDFTELGTSSGIDSSFHAPDGFESGPYWAYLSSDTVEDIIISGVGYDNVINYYKGGHTLWSRRIPYWGINWADEDSSLTLLTRYDTTALEQYRTCSGNFRGTGRTDLVALAPHGISFFANDPPFSLSKFRDALLYDTLAAFWQSPAIVDWHYRRILQGSAMPVFHRGFGAGVPDDFILEYRSNDTNSELPLVFRGGPEFGNKRINVSQPDYSFHDPGTYNTTVYSMVDAGDMTGTGNHTLLIVAGNTVSESAVYCFYVLGDELDDKVDMYYEQYHGGAYFDTLSANGDKYGDYIFGMPLYTDPDDATNKAMGMVTVIYGSPKIPLHNTHGLVHKENSDSELSIFPNPADRACNVVLPTSTPRSVLRLRDITGRLVFESSVSQSSPDGECSIPTQQLASGVYTIELAGPDQTRRRTLVVQH